MRRNKGFIANESRLKLVADIKSRYKTQIEDSIKKTRIYETQEYILDRVGFEETEVIFEKMDSVSAVLKYAGPETHAAVLNFASYRYPGGGFITGAMAQEEALCLESTLYAVISDKTIAAFYEENQRSMPKVGLLYSNRALYSEDITFFRTNAGITQETTCDVITCAAPNATRYLNAGGNIQVNNNALMNRVAFILDIAAWEGNDTLILGAYGCGVFGQNPWKLGAIYMDFFENKFKGVFKKIVIAVIDEKTLTRIKEGYELEQECDYYG